jgi:rare lipoprotein A
MRRVSAIGLAAALAGAGCVSPPLSPPATRPAPPASALITLPLAPSVPPTQVPDAVPRVEPRSAYGNPPFYEVFGVRYTVLPSIAGFRERGVASWYGPGFHEERTSTGEPYDMFGMTAAHKTLPLPAYVRVTNLENGRSVVVRVNDRGPFVGNRIIDLSYTAAAKLDMLRDGTAMVEVAAIDPAAVSPAPAATTTATAAPAATSVPAAELAAFAAAAPPPAHAPLYIQAGAFANPSNAERLAARLRGGGYGSIFVREHRIAGHTLYRVRIGPVPDVAEFDRIVAALAQAGVTDARLALD